MMNDQTLILEQSDSTKKPIVSRSRRKLLLAGSVVAWVAAFSILPGCGGGGTSSGAGFSNNISGVWSGTIVAGGNILAVVVTVNQAVSGRSLASSSVRNAAQALTGTLFVEGEGTNPVNGTKDGNVWSVSGSFGSSIVTVNQALTSANTSAGNLVEEIGGATNTFNLNLTRS